MLIEEITIKNILSFGPKGVTLPLRPLNVLIGPNGSGKSNFLDVIGFLKALPRDAWEPMRKTRSIESWMHQGLDGRIGFPAVVSVKRPVNGQPGHFLSHDLTIDLNSPPSFLTEEIALHWPGRDSPRHIVGYGVDGSIQFRERPESVQQDELSRYLSNLSVLAQVNELLPGPTVARMAKQYRSIRLYRDWEFSRAAPVRAACSTAVVSESLEEDCGNFVMVLNRIQSVPALKRELLERIRELYEGLSDFHFEVSQDKVELWLDEGDRKISTPRMSDGTVRYMCLLAILLNPNPPPLVCIEEPELGLHPDLVVRVADLLKEASTRMQLVVTTHSDMLLDALSDTPESIVVCSKEEGETVMTRLDAEELRPYLEEQTLSSLWSSGQLGGRRW